MTKLGEFLIKHYTIKELYDMPVISLKRLIKGVRVYVGRGR